MESSPQPVAQIVVHDGGYRPESAVAAVERLVDPTWRGALEAARSYTHLSAEGMSEHTKVQVLRDLGVHRPVTSDAEMLKHIVNAIDTMSPAQLLGFELEEDSENRPAAAEENQLKISYAEAVKKLNPGEHLTFFDFVNKTYPRPPEQPRPHRTLFVATCTAFDECVIELTTLLVPEPNPNAYSIFNIPLETVKAETLEFPSENVSDVAALREFLTAKMREASGNFAYKWPFASQSKLSWFAFIRKSATPHYDESTAKFLLVNDGPKEPCDMLCTCSANPDDVINVTYLTPNVDIGRVVTARILSPGLFINERRRRTMPPIGYERKTAATSDSDDEDARFARALELLTMAVP